MKQTLVRIDNLQVRLPGGGLAIRQANLCIEEKSIHSLVGESGAGKSMLGNALCGTLPPQVLQCGGTIRWQREKPILSHLPQDAASCLNPLLRIGTQLEETLTVHGVPKAEARERSTDWLQRVGFPEPTVLARAYPHELSGGMRQRVALALALCYKPHLLVADEPTSALDSILRAKILDLLRSLCQLQSTALLLVTHDLASAASSDTISVMYAGRIIETGPARSILQHARHPYTKALLACEPQLGARQAGLRPAIPGQAPRPQEDFRGCAFAPRCAQAWERCRENAPPLQGSKQEQVACWLHSEEAKHE